MKPVLFHPDAEKELDRSIGFYEEQQVGLGLDFQREVQRGLSQIVEAPSRWPIHKYGIHKFLLKGFPFYIYYLDLPEYIWIAAVAHCKRKPNYWKKRL